jgi:hypothetical protein
MRPEVARNESPFVTNLYPNVVIIKFQCAMSDTFSTYMRYTLGKSLSLAMEFCHIFHSTFGLIMCIEYVYRSPYRSVA